MHAVEHRESVRKIDVFQTMVVGNEIKSSMNH